jgi:hypothetical protein
LELQKTGKPVAIKQTSENPFSIHEMISWSAIGPHQNICLAKHNLCCYGIDGLKFDCHYPISKKSYAYAFKNDSSWRHQE